MNRVRIIHYLAVFAMFVFTVQFLHADTVSGYSSLFAFDTRTFGSLATDSASFVFDTRGAMGLGTSGTSSLFAFDTRSGKAVSMAIGGPAECAPGAKLRFECWAYCDDGTFAEVGSLCDWWIDGAAPAGTFVGGGQFTAGTASTPMTVKLRAGYKRPDGYIVSPPYEVTIFKALTVKMGSVVVTPDNPGGWLMYAAATAEGSYGSVVWQWQLAGVPLNDFHGSSVVDQHVGGEAGTWLLSVVATDGQGRRATASRKVVFDKSPVEKEPRLIVKPADPEKGHILDYEGRPFIFDSAKKATGLIVLTHGLWRDGNIDWLKRMALLIGGRLNKEKDLRPNICVLDWGEMANPYQIELPDSTGNYWADLGQDIYFVGTLPGQIIMNNLFDVQRIRPNAISEGVILSSWIQKQITDGNVDPNAPIQMIGHSAGGFVVGECARLLRAAGINVTQVTMLDTPLNLSADKFFFTDYPGVSLMERYYSSSGLGGFISPTVFQQTSPPNGYAREVPGSPFWTLDAHSYVHEWYTTTVSLGTEIVDGFYYSPFMGNGFHGLGSGGAFLRVASSDARSLSGDFPSIMGATTNIDIGDFSFFGDVTMSNGVYRVSENSNAGLVQTLALPVGAQVLRFRYRFAVPGDGDYLAVSWGTNNASLYVGPDVSGNQSTPVDAVVSVAKWAGVTNLLAFTLVSRGATNAVLELDQIRLTLSDDLDEDGLTTDQESTLGTDPLKADTDGDGLTDGDEVNIYHSNPLLLDSDGDGVADGMEIKAGTLPNDPDSCFKVVRTDAASGGQLIITWNGKAGRTYRVNRRTDLTQPNYDTLATGIPGVEPHTVYPIPLEAQALPSSFFWVELE